ncbi:hypothetical protein ARMGADRAFT_1011817, partial [Armillaria gallica]
MQRRHLGLVDFLTQTHVQPLPTTQDDLSHKGRRTPRRIATKGNRETEGTRRGTSLLSIPPQSSAHPFAPDISMEANSKPTWLTGPRVF